MTPKYMRIFDPRSVRAVGKGPHAQAEVVTGTHLYAYLQDLDLPPALVKSRGNSMSKSSSYSTENKNKGNDINKMFQIAERFASLEGKEFRTHITEAESHMAYEKEYTESSKRSLLQEIKVIKDVFLLAFYSVHNTISADMKTECFRDKMDTKSEEQPIQMNLRDSIHYDGMSLIAGVRQTHRFSVICADDTLVTAFKIMVRGECLPSNSNSSGCNSSGCNSSGCNSTGNGSGRESAEVSIFKSICVGNALLSALVISNSGTHSSCINGDKVIEKSTDLVVLCRSNSNSCSSSSNSNSRNSSAAALYAARVRLSSMDSLGIFRVPEGDKDGVQKVRLYVVPVPPQHTAPNRFPESSSEDGEKEEDIYGTDLNESVISTDDDISRRVAAVVGLGSVSVSERDNAGSNVDPRACLFRIDFQDLQFTDIISLAKATTTEENDNAGHTCGTNSIEGSTTCSVSLDDLMTIGYQNLGGEVGDVCIRQRLLNIDLPDDKGAILLEASAARGVVLVGIKSKGGTSGGKMIIVDMEVDEVEDEGDNDHENDNDDDENNESEQGSVGKVDASDVTMSQ